MDVILDKDERVALTKWHVQEKQLDKALLQIKHVLEEDSEHDEAMLIAARLYAQLQLFGRARQLFEKYLNKHTKDIDARFQLGMCYFDQNDYSNALQTWKGILGTNNHYPPALFYSAITLLRQNKSVEGVTQLKTILATVEIDNFYYNKAKELLMQIENQPSSIASKPVNDVYKVEH